MDSTIFDLKKPFTKISVALRGRIQIMNLNLNTSVSILVGFIDDNGALVDNRIYTIEQPEYGQWGDNDQFIIDYVNAKLAEEK